MERVDTIVGEDAGGVRLDRFLADRHPDVSRSAVQREIREGRVLVAGEVVSRPSQSLRPGQTVSWTPPQAAELEPKAIALSVLFEDDTLIVIDKPTGLVIHPGAGKHDATLVEGLLATRSLPQSDDPARPGIVHRLDKETSGVIVVAKTPSALSGLQRQFAERTVAKSYLAVVEGKLEEDEGMIDAPVGRDPARPSRMAVLSTGRSAQTDFDVLERLGDRALVWARPHTGRTHQIRVHFSYIKHPVVGDSIYPGRMAAGRLMLHAWRLAIRHPVSGDVLQFEAPVPEAFPAHAYADLPWSEVPDIA